MPVTISTPCSRSCVATASAISESSRWRICGAFCSKITFTPKDENTWANSVPTGPAPTMMIDSGNSVNRTAWSEVINPDSLSPSIGGTNSREPVPMTIFSAARRLVLPSFPSVTSISCSETNRACPQSRSMPALCRLRSIRGPVSCATTWSRYFATSPKSNRGLSA